MGGLEIVLESLNLIVIMFYKDKKNVIIIIIINYDSILIFISISNLSLVNKYFISIAIPSYTFLL